MSAVNARSPSDQESIRTEVLPHFPVASNAPLAPFGNGLINETFALTDPRRGAFVLQRVNPLFSPAIHRNIHAVTAALVRAGLPTPVLVPTNDGQLCLQLAGPAGEPPTVWRLMTFVAGHSFDIVSGPGQARAAGALIARFHAALEGLPHVFVGLRGGVHDTPKHLAALRQAIAEHPGHRLYADVATLGAAILTAVGALPALPVLTPRICHGDLKFNNVLFASATAPGDASAVCLIDLDTVGPLSLAYELGDAWRSWCNRSGEDEPEAVLDLEVFAASLDGYRQALGRSLGGDERRALLLGPEWISVELAARFAADALREGYFGWDRARFPGRGEHNLVRARGQFSLHGAFVAAREQRARSLA
jgi:Ser/Thr protein kinase RdoA (MazF antagonist)